VHDVDGHSFKLKGHLTIRGVTKEIELLGEMLGEGPDPWGGTRVGFEARTIINRKDFGLNWNVALEAGGFLVGEDVEIVLEVQAVKAS
jgi:polyisoprenoid-binding protein YceI